MTHNRSLRACCALSEADIRSDYINGPDVPPAKIAGLSRLLTIPNRKDMRRAHSAYSGCRSRTILRSMKRMDDKIEEAVEAGRRNAEVMALMHN